MILGVLSPLLPSPPQAVTLTVRRTWGLFHWLCLLLPGSLLLSSEVSLRFRPWALLRAGEARAGQARAKGGWSQRMEPRPKSDDVVSASSFTTARVPRGAGRDTEVQPSTDRVTLGLSFSIRRTKQSSLAALGALSQLGTSGTSPPSMAPTPVTTTHSPLGGGWGREYANMPN